MKKLIKKELIVNRNILLGVLLFPLFSFFVTFSDYKLQSYIMFSYFVAFITIIVISSIIGDKRSKGTDTLFLSLAVNRDDIIKSKYLVYSLFPLAYSTVLYVSYGIIKWPFSFWHDNIDFDIVIISTSISLILLAFVIPILFKWLDKYPMIGSLAYILLMLGNVNLTSWVMDLYLNINYGLTSIILLIVAILVYLVSMKVSINIYKSLSP